MADHLLSKLDLDDVLVKFKVYGRYHAVTITILSLVFILDFAWYCNHVFVVEKVDYRCMQFHNKSNQGKKYNLGIKVLNNTTDWCRNPASCPQWIYDNPNSFVAELVCQDWKRTSVGSVHIFGYMLGVFTVGSLSDRFGRKTLIIITSVAAGVAGTAKSFITYYWLYVAFEFFEAAIDPMSPAYMLAVEMVATNSRVAYTTICMMGLGIGGMVLALMAWLIPYWRTRLRVIYAPGLLAIFFIYWLDESPRWLLANGKKNAAVKIIRNAAKLNKLELSENLNKITYETEEGPCFLAVLKETFKSASLLKRFIVCSIWWISSTFVNFGLLLNSSSLAGNKYLNFGLSSAMKSLGILITAYIINKFNRRGPLVFCFLVCAIICFGLPFLPKNLFWLQITNYMISFLLSCASLYIIYIFTSELFPTQSRNSMHALCSSIGRFGSIIAPQMPLLTSMYWPGLQYAVYGVVSLIAALVTLLVPDTADRSLPDTVCQAEKMESKT